MYGKVGGVCKNARSQNQNYFENTGGAKFRQKERGKNRQKSTKKAPITENGNRPEIYQFFKEKGVPKNEKYNPMEPSKTPNSMKMNAYPPETLKNAPKKALSPKTAIGPFFTQIRCVLKHVKTLKKRAK